VRLKQCRRLLVHWLNLLKVLQVVAHGILVHARARKLRLRDARPQLLVEPIPLHDGCVVDRRVQVARAKGVVECSLVEVRLDLHPQVVLHLGVGANACTSEHTLVALIQLEADALDDHAGLEPLAVLRDDDARLKMLDLTKLGCHHLQVVRDEEFV